MWSLCTSCRHPQAAPCDADGTRGHVRRHFQLSAPGMVLLACGSGRRPGLLLQTLQSPGQPLQQRATQSKCPSCHRGDSTAHGVSRDLLSQNVGGMEFLGLRLGLWEISPGVFWTLSETMMMSMWFCGQTTSELRKPREQGASTSGTVTSCSVCWANLRNVTRYFGDSGIQKMLSSVTFTLM